MARMQHVLNFTVVALLIVIAAGFLFMPRYNYGVLTSRVGALEGKANALENGFEKVNLLAGPGEEKRAAVVANIDSIARNLKRLEGDAASFLEALVSLSTLPE